MHRKPAGFTLIELLIALVIISILSAIAYPSYTNYVTRSNRTLAQTFITNLANRQEQFFIDNKQYAPSLVGLGFATATVGVDDKNAAVAVDDADRIYLISLSDTGTTTYTINAAPQLIQATNDSACNTLTLTHTGVKGKTGTGSHCW
jgi:type IV pilus assembly protein PilE